MATQTVIQRYFALAEDAGFSFNMDDINDHTLVIEEDERFLLVIENSNEVGVDEWYMVSYFSKTFMDYPGAPLFEGSLLNCLTYISRLEAK